MGIHRVYFDAPLPQTGQTVHLSGEEAHHALAVKRVEAGALIEVLDGKGKIATARLMQGKQTRTGKRGEWLDATIESIREVPRAVPFLTVASAAPKGGRLDDMIGQLAQIGVAQWRPLVTARGEVKPREFKLERMERVAAEACKQSGRAWMMELGAEWRLKDALASAGAGNTVVFADASGERVAGGFAGIERALLLIGPEGGWTDEEVGQAVAARAANTGTVMVARLGRHVMRIETAAVVGAGLLMG